MAHITSRIREDQSCFTLCEH